MTLDKIDFNTSYFNTGMTNMFSNPMLTYSTTPMFDFTNFMPSAYTGMDTFMPSYQSFSPFGSFNFNFEMPQFDMSMLMDMYNATLQNMDAQFNKLKGFLQNSAVNWNTTPTASLEEVNYDKATAVKLAKNVKAHAHTSSTGHCARYVSNAIEASGIPVTRGHAFEMAGNLKNNEHFQEIKITKDELADLPAGCVLVYPKGSAGYSSQYGHIEITLGNGKAASDFVNNNIKYSSNMKVFVPVTA